MTEYGAGRNQTATVGATNVRLVLAPVGEDVPGAPLPPGPKVGEPAPAIRVKEWVNGAGIGNLEELRGKSVVLFFSSAYNAAAWEWNDALKAVPVLETEPFPVQVEPTEFDVQ